MSSHQSLVSVITPLSNTWLARKIYWGMIYTSIIFVLVMSNTKPKEVFKYILFELIPNVEFPTFNTILKTLYFWNREKYRLEKNESWLPWAKFLNNIRSQDNRLWGPSLWAIQEIESIPNEERSELENSSTGLGKMLWFQETKIQLLKLRRTERGV